MTDNERKILTRLNKSRSQNNVDRVLSEELEMTKDDVVEALSSLLGKGYISENSNTNQRNEGLRAWWITHDGEIKASELKKKEIRERKEAPDKGLSVAKKTLIWTIVGVAIVALGILLSELRKG